MAGAQVFGSTTTPGVPATDGISSPLVAPPNWVLLAFNSASTTGSICDAVSVNAGHVAVAGLLKAAASDAAERSIGITGITVLRKVPGDKPLRCLVPW